MGSRSETSFVVGFERVQLADVSLIWQIISDRTAKLVRRTGLFNVQRFGLAGGHEFCALCQYSSSISDNIVPKRLTFDSHLYDVCS